MMMSSVWVLGSVRALATRSSLARESGVSCAELNGKFSVMSKDAGGRTTWLAVTPRRRLSVKGAGHCGSRAQTMSSTEGSCAHAAPMLINSEQVQRKTFRYFMGFTLAGLCFSVAWEGPPPRRGMPFRGRDLRIGNRSQRYRSIVLAHLDKSAVAFASRFAPFL